MSFATVSGSARLYDVLEPAFGDAYLILRWTMVALIWSVPGIFGLWVGVKRKNLGLWRHLVPMGAVVGIATLLGVFAYFLFSAQLTFKDFFIGQIRLEEVVTVIPEFMALIGPLMILPAIILFTSGGFIGNAWRRRTAGAQYSSGIQLGAGGLILKPETSGNRWTPRKQAMVGFAGTILSAIITIMGSAFIEAFLK